MRTKALAALFIFLAAAAWGAEYVLPLPAVGGLNPIALVFWGHIVGLAFLFPFVLRPSRREFRKITPAQYPHLFAVAVGGEVLAGLVFSFAYREVGQPSSVFLLMLRPFFVLAFAFFLLGEKRGGSFLSWAGWVFVGAFVVLVFDPQMNADMVATSSYGKGMLLGLGAVTLWALATVSGKQLLTVLSPSTLLFLRWSLSLLGFAVGMLVLDIPFEPAKLADPALLFQLAARSVMIALIPLWIYYQGLRLLPASLASFVELTCPLVVVFLPAFLGGRSVADAQWLGGLSIVAGVALLLRLELEFEAGKGKKKR
jgi:drug/metabolite transporter (DMT)-like permease